MNTATPITITARWDHSQAPAGEAATRGLLIDIETAAPQAVAGATRPPVNIALVIDRSGSMHGAPMHCAIEAAVGVARQLGSEDRLSVVAYDNEVDVIVNGLGMDQRGQQLAEAAIRELHARGSTNLAEGWLKGARCVSSVMDECGFNAGHVVLLSDGRANMGEQNPTRLAEIAGELAARGVTSTCVGIGADYSLLQMTAIAEGGQGELHQSSVPEEIIEVLAGEIGEQMQIVARDFVLVVPRTNMESARQLTHYRDSEEAGACHFSIGNLVAGQTRRVALLVELAQHQRPTTLAFALNSEWLDADSNQRRHGEPLAFALSIVPKAQFNEDERDKEVAETIAQLWMARQSYEAMMHNERGDYAAAVNSIDSQQAEFMQMIEGLDDALVMLNVARDVRERSSRHWDGLSKKEALVGARKEVRGKADWRRGRA